MEPYGAFWSLMNPYESNSIPRDHGCSSKATASPEAAAVAESGEMLRAPDTLMRRSLRPLASSRQGLYLILF